VSEWDLPVNRASTLRSNLSETSAIDHMKVVEHYPESDLDKGIVGWEGQDDSTNPRYVSCLAAKRLMAGSKISTEISQTHANRCFLASLAESHF
jgi:hypothetical protein